MLKKSQVLKEGYNKGLRAAYNVIKNILDESYEDVMNMTPMDVVADWNKRHANDGLATYAHGGHSEPQFAGSDDLVDCARAGYLAGVRKALQNGSDVDETDGKGRTALHWAAFGGNDRVAKELLDAGAHVNAVADYGMTPLLCTFEADRNHQRRLRVLARLLNAGADVDAQTDAGDTALHMAAYQSDLEAVKMLLKHGADPDITDHHGASPSGMTDSAEIRAALNKASRPRRR